ncbi:uncharacterized protein BX663DRAFT_516945 [Cokeromyces recurvatus]|uniref:uncharacterized protein n=1 Tax=Cokeromyces recurvatus TaxID=90255 RepID=UPI00222107BC|nr:uncharacterized protein BX663DRAFT_516945 [Cokeromyces recurvatus]KAI7900591.1 hypothetical protein BX663DRAFT_516945 [Cokeromyces recurvatus]
MSTINSSVNNPTHISKEKKRRPIKELNWILSNTSNFNHITFFNHFKNYKKRTAIRRFKIAVDYFIVDEFAETQILNNFHVWNANNEGMNYWIHRDIEIALNTNSNDSIITADSGTVVDNSVTSTSVRSFDIFDQIKDFLTRNIFLVDAGHYLVGQLNVHECFHRFQLHIKDLIISKQLLTIESHVPHILSTSSTLLLCSTIDISMNSYFDNAATTVLDDMHIRLGLHSKKFPRLLLIKMIDIINDINLKKYECSEGISQLYQLMKGEEELVKRCITLMIRLLQTLPLKHDYTSIKEQDLCSRYLVPVLQSFFDYRFSEEKILFHFKDNLNMECLNDISLTRSRPDGLIVQERSSGQVSLGFIEVKPLKEANNHYKMNMDLIRLSVFSKNAMDKHKLRNVMTIQAIGTNLTFYLMQHFVGGLYIMVELDHLRFPTSINELELLVGFLDRILNLMAVFKEHCAEQREVVIDGLKQTLRSPVLTKITTTTVDRKRTNYCQHYCH